MHYAMVKFVHLTIAIQLPLSLVHYSVILVAFKADVETPLKVHIYSEKVCSDPATA